MKTRTLCGFCGYPATPGEPIYVGNARAPTPATGADTTFVHEDCDRRDRAELERVMDAANDEEIEE